MQICVQPHVHIDLSVRVAVYVTVPCVCSGSWMIRTTQPTCRQPTAQRESTAPEQVLVVLRTACGLICNPSQCKHSHYMH